MEEEEEGEAIRGSVSDGGVKSDGFSARLGGDGGGGAKSPSRSFAAPLEDVSPPLPPFTPGGLLPFIRSSISSILLFRGIFQIVPFMAFFYF